MKKLLLLLFSILISLSSFGKTVCVETDAENRSGIMYLPNEVSGFTGQNLCKYNNGQLWRKGNYIDGILDNETEYIYYDNGQVKMESNWTFDPLDGEIKLNGKVTDWYESGELMVERNYKNGGLDGKTFIWFKNGQLKSQGSYKNNKRDGTSIWYYKNGNKWQAVSYKASVTVSMTSWHENGNLESKSKWKDNLTKDGLQVRWHENGKIKSQGNYIDHQKQGDWTFWDENGQIDAEVFFKNGQCLRGNCSRIENQE